MRRTRSIRFSAGNIEGAPCYLIKLIGVSPVSSLYTAIFQVGLRNGFVVLSGGIDEKQRLRYHLVKSDYGDDGVVVVAKRMAKVLL